MLMNLMWFLIGFIVAGVLSLALGTQVTVVELFQEDDSDEY